MTKMAEYIEREKIWPALNAACVPYDRAIQKAIESIPAADVRPVVYCKDCMYGVQGKKSLECEKHRYVWNNLNRWVNDDDFCSWGIKGRKADGN